MPVYPATMLFFFQIVMIAKIRINHTLGLKNRSVNFVIGASDRQPDFRVEKKCCDVRHDFKLNFVHLYHKSVSNIYCVRVILFGHAV